MQEPNFEKQVRQKMEELSFTPSEPVWQKVEEQIRKKKERRRVFFWILPFALLGGIYFYLSNKNVIQLSNEKSSIRKIDQPSSPNVKTEINDPLQVNKSTAGKQRVRKNNLADKVIIPSDPNHIIYANDNKIKNAKIKTNIKTAEIPGAMENMNVIQNDNESGDSRKVNSNNYQKELIAAEKLITDTITIKNNTTTTDSINSPSVEKIADTSAVAPNDTLKNTNDIVKKQPLNRKSKWHWNAYAAGGRSGVTTAPLVGFGSGNSNTQDQ